MTSQIQVERPAGGGETPRLEGRTLRLRPIVPAVVVPAVLVGVFALLTWWVGR